MQNRPQKPDVKTSGGDPDAQARLIRRLLIGGGILLVLVFGFMIWNALQKESQQERWDTLSALRKKHEPDQNQDPILQPPYEDRNPERVKYIEILEKFLDLEAKDAEGPLKPHTRYLIAKTIADHLLANPGLIDQEQRSAFYAKATKQLEAIHAEHPDFPLNWTMLRDDATGFPSLTKRFVAWLKENEAWEKEHMLRSVAPDAGVRVLVRTARGDMLMGLYSELAPEWTRRFLERAAAGGYDGTFFTSRRKAGDAAEPGEYAIRAAGSASSGMTEFDVAAHLEAAKLAPRGSALPSESRNRLPFERGVVAAWHDSTDEYDDDEQFMIVTARSPVFDYKYTPIGKLVDESGIDSLTTADRIFGGVTWRDDNAVAEDTENRTVLDFFQAPVRIVKVLVYDNGTLRTPTAPAPTKAKVEDDEAKLTGMKADRYKQEPPVRPAKDEPAKDDDPKKDDGDK